MIELTSDFLEQLNSAAQAVSGKTFDLHTAKGQADMERFAYMLTENPESSIAIQIFDYIEASSKKLEVHSEPKKVWHAGFTPKIDHDFHMAEKDNFFRRGNPSPIPRR
ncbi:hypothetical protein LLY42_25390 [Pseudomonas frederiksbergensis]|nr:hypothetical protein LLY42_25390 [Pseudomonas frederiksbergensis]